MVEQGMITIRKKCTYPRLLDDKLHGVLVRIVVAAQRSARVMQGFQQLHRLGVERCTSLCQACRVGAAVYQIDPRPGLERLDAARKCRLGDVAQLGRAAETAGFGQRNKVF